jgi:hypothetical protein
METAEPTAHVAEASTSSMSDPYPVIGATSHAMPEAVAAVEVAVPAIVPIAIRIAVIAIIIRARHSAAISRLIDGTDRTIILVGIGLGRGRLRSRQCSHGQANAGN